LIAVGGDSGVGKTTLCKGIDRIFGAERIETLCLDDYHSLDRAQRKLLGFTALDPRANNFAAMEEDLWTLREGGTIEKPIYDHSDGSIRGPERVAPKEIIIVQGLFPLYTRALRSLFDITVWLDPETDIKVGWKIQRDTLQRGYTEDEVRAEIEKRQPDIERHIQPQGRHADMVVRFYYPPDWKQHRDPAKLSVQIHKAGRFAPLDYSDFPSVSTTVRPAAANGSSAGTIVNFDAEIDDQTSNAVQDKIWQHMDTHAHLRPERLGEFKDAGGNFRMSHTLALAQLLIARRVALVENELMETVG
jgi:phosphoribulokinase